jgi:hypothetical protein
MARKTSTPEPARRHRILGLIAAGAMAVAVALVVAIIVVVMPAGVAADGDAAHRRPADQRAGRQEATAWFRTPAARTSTWSPSRAPGSPRPPTIR